MKMSIPIRSGHAAQTAVTQLATEERKNAARVGSSCLPVSRTAAVSHVHMKLTNLASAATAHVQSMQIAGGAAALVQTTQTANAAAVAERIQLVSITKASAAEALSMNHVSQELQEWFSKWI